MTDTPAPAREPICRCGHKRDDHQSKTWQEDGQKHYGQVCEHCQCRSYLEAGGPLDTLINSFRPAVAASGTACADCGTALNAGEAKTFTVCDACWDKAYPASPAGRSEP